MSEDELAPEFPGLGDVESVLDLLEDEVTVVLQYGRISDEKEYEARWKVSKVR